MKPAWILLTLSAHAAAQEAPAPALPSGPWVAEYKIEVELDPDAMALHGKADVRVRNSSDAELTELPFHLYPNAWSRTDTRWVLDDRAQRQVVERGAADGGYLMVAAVHDGAGNDLGAATAIDETLMRVTLPQGLAPGDETRLVIAFTTKLPRIVARMGKLGRHVAAMQWFPKLCKLRDDGSFADWPFREPSEFFADFGSYEVRITLPAGYQVEATGRRVTNEENAQGGTQTVTFQAAAVHDFAWCADPNFIRRVERTGRGVELVLMSQPYLEPKAQLALDAVRFAMERLDEWLFPYPYERLVIDVVPHGEGGGMEYPMLFTIGGGSPEFVGWVRERSQDPAGVAVHEFIHQYFQGMVATNEMEEAWLDEGLTSYFTIKVLDEFFRDRSAGAGRGLPLLAADRVYLEFLRGGGLLEPVAGYDLGLFSRAEDTLFGFRVPDLALRGLHDRVVARKERYAPVAEVTPLRTRSWEAWRAGERNAYRAIAYSKPVLMLTTLERHAGWERTLEFLRTWARRHAFAHPTTDDFLALAQEMLDPEHHAFLAACVETGATVDYAVDEVRAIDASRPQGFTRQQRPGDPVTAQFADAPDAGGVLRRLKALFDDPAPPAEGTPHEPLWRNEVVVRNRGTLHLPVQLELRFADGSVERRTLDGTRPFYRIELEPGPVALLAAEVDPERKIALDLDVTNNARLAQPDRASARVLGAFHQFWVQTWLSAIAWSS